MMNELSSLIREILRGRGLNTTVTQYAMRIIVDARQWYVVNNLIMVRKYYLIYTVQARDMHARS